MSIGEIERLRNILDRRDNQLLEVVLQRNKLAFENAQLLSVLEKARKLRIPPEMWPKVEGVIAFNRSIESCSDLKTGE